MNKEQICKWVEHFRTRSGTQIVRFRKHWHTDNPSIQGIWHPFLFKDPKINTKIFPDEELSRFVQDTSATEHVLKMYEEQKDKLPPSSDTTESK
jgi:large subunit ribosomal protein L43